jgi:monoamine oxidase
VTGFDQAFTQVVAMVMTKISRRHFLSASAAATAAAFGAPNQDPGRQRIIVLGAGLAGLCTAYELQNRGYANVTVLEAQMRPGGRVKTLRHPFAPGVYAEAGAGRIPINHQITQHYARHFELTLVPATITGVRNFYHVRDQRVFTDAAANPATTWPLDLTNEERTLGLGGLQRKYIDTAVQQALSNGFDKDPITALMPWDGKGLADWLRGQGLSRGATELLTMGFGDNVGSAAWFLLYKLNLYGATMSYHIAGGNDLLPEAFAKRVRDIRYGEPVVSITQSETGVRVTTSRGETLHADRIVSTLPCPVVGDLFSRTILSHAKAEAIANQSYSHTAKVFLQTRSRFWLKAGLSGNVTTDLPIERLMPDAGNDAAGHGVLAAYPIGPYANQLEGMDEKDRAQAALTQARKIFPELATEFEGSFSKCWGTDPWQKGSFTVQAPGQLRYLATLAKQEGRIHFAGEHTSRWTGWMQGALESAQRVVREIAGG